MKFSGLFFSLLISTLALTAASIGQPGNVLVDWPGTEKFTNQLNTRADDSGAQLGNGVVDVTLGESGAVFNLAGTRITLSDICSIEIAVPDADSQRLYFKRVAPYSVENYTPPTIPVRHADALNETGAAVCTVFENAEKGIRLHWKISLRGNAPYFIQHFSFSRIPTVSAESNATNVPVRMTRLRLGEFPLSDPAAVEVIGKVPGSPIALSENVICGIEQPAFKLTTLSGTQRVALELDCDLDLSQGKTFELSSMIGYFPKEQRRRAFNFYLERERAAPSRQFLVHNGWYSFGLSPTEERLAETIEAYGNALVKERGVKLDAFVLDDGWDDPVQQLWSPSTKKFPNGLDPLTKAAKQFGADFGIWISPTGGYFGLTDRLHSCKKYDGISEDASVFDLADPIYEKWFSDKCFSLVRDNNVSFFKWDRIGENADQHFLNLCALAKKLRRERPHLFINASVGTWPSPFWLNHVDSTWRGGADIAFYNRNIGDKRDQWISYRDFELIDKVVERAPLYPINSVMHHGIALGIHYQGAACAEAGNDLSREIFSYFALGSNLQELYIDFHLLDADPAESRAWAMNKIKKTPTDRSKPGAAKEILRKAPWLPGNPIWDCIAQAKKWAQDNAPALVDMHWVKGRPSNPPGAYAFAGWYRGNGVIYLRNASSRPSAISFSLREAFELPPGEPEDSIYAMKRIYTYGNIPDSLADAPARQELSFVLNPLEICVLQARRISSDSGNTEPQN